MNEYRLSSFIQGINNIKTLISSKIDNSKYPLKLFYILYFIYIKKVLKKNAQKINSLDYYTIIDFCEFAKTETNNCKATVYYHNNKEDNVKLQIKIPDSDITIYIINHFDQKINIAVDNNVDNTRYTRSYYKVAYTEDKIMKLAIEATIQIIINYISDYIDDKININ